MFELTDLIQNAPEVHNIGSIFSLEFKNILR